jgi:type II secretory pathway pseudopilin PulG
VTATPAPVERTLALPRVAAALATIVILALVLPYAAVQSLHHRRLAASDRQMRAIADAVATAFAGNAAGIPAGTQILAGSGPRPIVQEDLWTTAAAFPLARVIGETGPDPWGNAYLVNIRDRRQAWVISAGPDGILQTPFTSGTASPAGDDRIAPIR